MIAPRYVGASTTTVSPRSRNVLPTSSSASIAPLVISSSSSAGRRPCSVSMPRGERVERAGEPARRRVLERGRLARGGELRDQRRGALARERQRVGKAAGERDQVGHAEEGEHLRDPVADVGARALREERLPLRRLGRGSHDPTIDATRDYAGSDGDPSLQPRARRGGRVAPSARSKPCATRSSPTRAANGRCRRRSTSRRTRPATFARCRRSAAGTRC